MTEKRITPTQAALVLVYVGMAVVRQVFHDLRSIRRWAGV